MKKTIALLVAFAVAFTPVVSFASYGGGGAASSIGSSLERDDCPNGDFSRSYYDNDCGTNPSGDESSNEGATLDGYIYFDSNEDGIFNGSEDGVQGAVVTLKSLGGSILDTDVSGSDGYYAFYNVAAGTYRVHVSLPSTNRTFAEELLTFFAPSVNAANDYEFTVVVGTDDEDEGTIINAGNVPVVDGEIDEVVQDDTDMDDDNEMESMDDEETMSIFDIIREENENREETISMDSESSNNEFVLPTSLPNTGAAL